MPPTAIARELTGERRGRLTQLDASFDLRWALTAAATGLTPGPEWLDPANLNDPAIRAFEDKIAFEPRDDWQDEIREQLETLGYFLRIPTEVEVHARGEVYVAAAEYASGDPQTEQTAATDEDLVAKFEEWARRLLGRDAARRAATAILGLDERSSVAPLVEALVR
jgi:2-methylcitrate dehydratase PrpD